MRTRLLKALSAVERCSHPAALNGFSPQQPQSIATSMCICQNLPELRRTTEHPSSGGSSTEQATDDIRVQHV
jgi:hypothetical protein